LNGFGFYGYWSLGDAEDMEEMTREPDHNSSTHGIVVVD